MKNIIFPTAIILLLSIFTASAEITVKMKDISYIDGLKENQIFGFGLVVGLQGTGDSKIPITNSSLRNLLKNLGLEEGESAKTKNVAAVMITANLPEFARIGDRIDISVSSIGDAKSLEGGILIQSPLRGADNLVYAVAQGKISNMNEKRGAGGKAIKTNGIIPMGAIVEKDIESTFANNNTISFVLKNWDFSVADDLIKQSKEKYPESNPSILQSGKIQYVIPANIPMSEFIAGIQEIELTPKYQAKVIVNEKDGTIVMGGDVKISESVVSKDGITIRVEGVETKVSAVELKDSSSVKDLVETLNYIGLTTTDIISILRALKDAGALHAELIIK